MEPIPEIPLKMIAESSLAKAVIEGNHGYQEAGDGHKLGGKPDWIQYDETPTCPECQEPMDFYGRLETFPHQAPVRAAWRYSCRSNLAWLLPGGMTTASR